jgi:hypothetical protein
MSFRVCVQKGKILPDHQGEVAVCKGIIQELEYIVPLTVAQKLKILQGEIDDVLHCEVNESFNIHLFF